MSNAQRLEQQTNTGRRTLPHLRWYICGLLFFATTVNYIDRQVLGLLKPLLEHDLHWSEADFGWIVFAFQGAYAIMMPVVGRIIDWLGTRAGYALALIVWSVASMSHALAHSTLGFAAARFGLGIGEAGNFPAAIKTVAEWFPKRERALATGIFNSGTNVGAIIAPLLVPVVALHFGWRACFLVTGGLDLVWLVFWLSFYKRPREHPLMSRQELAALEEDHADQPAQQKVPYRDPHTRKALAAFVIGKFLTDPVWWFYLYWLPGFLALKFGLSLTKLGPPLIVIYVAADVGSVFGGWLAGRFLALGWSVAKARKSAMLVFALSVLCIVPVQYTGGNLWLTVALISIATASHQGWSANIFTLASDLFPQSTVASVVGLGGMGGAAGGMLVSLAVGYWLDFSHEAYGPLFVAAGLAYLIALAVIHILLPTFKPQGSAIRS
jgi:MFS transporter, ACS family, hexuronate transporter